MANIKQQKKRVKTDAKRRQQNTMFKSSLKLAMRRVEQYVEQNDKEKAITALNNANKKLDKAVVKGLHHKNYVAKRKSRLAKQVNELS